MKIKILYVLFVFITILNSCAGEFFFINFSGTPILENVISNSIINDAIVVGKTYDINDGNAYSIITTSNDYVSIKFANELSIKIEPNTTLSLNTFDIKTNNTNDYPEKLIHVNSVLTVTLQNGQINMVNEGATNATEYISTGQATIIPSVGKYIIKTEKNLTEIVCVEGTVKINDRLNRNHYSSLSVNDILVITPPPKLSGKIPTTITKQSIFSNDVVPQDQRDAYKDFFNFDYNTVMFISFSNKIYGIKK